MPNDTKKISFSAYQFDLHYIKQKTKMRLGKKVSEDVYAIEWSFKFVYELLKEIFDNEAVGRKMNINDEWFMLLDDLQQDDKFIYGKFKSAAYGTKNNLVHADTLESRENPKDKREGEESHTHFLIRKEDGFMLLQTTDIKMSRSKVQNYIEKYGEESIAYSKYTDINICSLVNLDLLDEIKKLDKINATVIEINAKEKSDENEFVQDLQDEIESIQGTHVTLEFKARYSREGLGAMIPFIQKYKGQKGVTSIKVIGEQSGSSRSFNVDSYSERYRPTVKIDANNSPISEDVYDKIKNIGVNRDLLKRGD
ncbi:hypothetical protein B4102_3409 [Heyndrickxia sporothermodurans]|uniref:Uncharacterized protein n=1 Tax=Heyndrickxia sporothermodurans TaxID=46224 RepID=A0A150KTP3_9BACI|nr:hypothetical protein [Heyndrickxia sporothermodurans]KYD03491.1 hypothetical protein B4102_3409 [Heyndrickxia sporothermodurans]